MDSSGAQQSSGFPGSGKLGGMELNGRVLKEPRGFLRVVQFIFAIFAFATTSGFSTHFSFKVKGCEDNQVYTVEYGYPFRIRDEFVMDCQGRRIAPIGDFSSQSQYFVASGVLAFLYCLVTLGLYIFYDKLYRANPLVPMVDFGISVIMAVFWLTSSAAWSQGVADLKYFANPENFVKPCRPATDCLEDIYAGRFASLNVSLLFGYANFILWAGNLWFLFKETTWFLSRTNKAQSPQI